MKKISSILLIICMLFTGCTQKREISGFFAWMDGYLAMAEGEEFSFSLTFFSELDKIPFDVDEVTCLSFDNLEHIIISDYSITPMDADKTQKYIGYAFDLTVKAEKKGIFRTDKLIAGIDNSTVVFPIGKWVFDIEDAVTYMESEEIDIWNSPAAGGDSRTFAYDYSMEDNNAIIKEIWLSEDIVLSEDEGLPLSNVIELPQTLEAPINFIRPKIILNVDGKEIITFGMSYYSGAMGFREDVLDKSKERNMIEI